MKIAFLSMYSPDDRKASSGTNYKMAEELSKIGELKWVKIKHTQIAGYINKGVRFWNKHFRRKIYLEGTYIGSKILYKKIKLSEFNDCDLIVAFFCMPILANLKISKPIIYFTDATYQVMIDYHPQFSDLFQFNKRQGCQLEFQAMNNSKAIILSSKWAADSAIGYLKQSNNKVHIIEFGANIDDQNIPSYKINKSHSKECLNILFLGVNWERKGGPKAVGTIKWLNKNGIPAKLHIVGVPNLSEEIKRLPYIIDYGFLNKNIKSDYCKLTEIIQKCDCLLLPTINEAAGIAFIEAAAYGLPSFTHDTGGISNYVINGETGYLLPLDSTEEDFGKIIKDTVTSGKLGNLSYSAYQLYINKLNWSTWGKRVGNVILSILH